MSKNRSEQGRIRRRLVEQIEEMLEQELDYIPITSFHTFRGFRSVKKVVEGHSLPVEVVQTRNGLYAIRKDK